MRVYFIFFKIEYQINITIDLHIHTTISDGTYTPKELVDYAVKKKLSAIAITDHDTMDGIQEAADYIRENELPLELIPGMEVSTSSPISYFGIHILAYFIDKNENEMATILNSVHNNIKANSIYTKDAITLITKLGGIPVLAHPQEYGLSIDQLDKLLGELASYGLKGIECIYPTHSDKYIEQIKKIALHHDLLITGGTDFHGSRKPGIDLGSGFGDMTIPYDIINSLKNIVII
ncbi:MAG: PHP domain-containing protein [Prolixibacteraceae bacterium]